MSLVKLTAKRLGPSEDDLSRPTTYMVDSSDIKKISRNISAGASGGSVFQDASRGGSNRVEVYEDPSQVRAQINIASGNVTGLYDTPDVFNGVSASGTTQATATLLTKYWNSVSAVVITTVDGVSLPASPAVGQACVVLNAASGVLDTFAHTASATIDSAASGVAKSQAVGEAIHYVCTTSGDAGVWKSALSENNA